MSVALSTLFIGLLVIVLIFTTHLIYQILSKILPAKRLKLNHLPGQKAKTISSIGPTPFDTGSIKFKGDIFPAITKEHAYIPKGTTVSIVALEGIRVIVQSENKG